MQTMVTAISAADHRMILTESSISRRIFVTIRERQGARGFGGRKLHTQVVLALKTRDLGCSLDAKDSSANAGQLSI